MAVASLVTLHGVGLAFGGHDLLRDVDLNLQPGDRLCLLGRNGSGKSSLLKIMAGAMAPDDGKVSYTKGTRVAYLDQEMPDSLAGTALEVATERAGAEIGGTALGSGVADSDDGLLGSALAATDHRVEAARLLTQLGVEEDAEVQTLSGGGRRRVLLAGVLAAGADILLLDEPTNHLDIDTVIWLEDYLLRGAPTRTGTDTTPGIVFVTHDRAFARRLATRVAEIDRGVLYAFRCGYTEFLDRREELLDVESKARAKFDKLLAQEEAWLTRGVKARRTRNEGRVRKLMAMREEHSKRRDRAGSVSMQINAATRSGNLVIEAENAEFSYDESPLITDVTTLILRGDRVGIAGPNGSGKTTLLKLLLGDLEPTGGHLRRGVGLEIVYLDQMRSALDSSKTVAENLGDGSDHLRHQFGTKHIRAYLQDFLFDADDAEKPVSILSGGERNRLLLAKLFSQPSNLLVLDEPTNDLDVDTLEILEDRLLDYNGTILLVSHDRELLDNVVTECLVLPGDGTVESWVGGYSEWRASRGAVRAARASAAASGRTAITGERATKKSESRPPGEDSQGSGPRRDRSRKLTFKERFELDALPDKIAAVEERIGTIHGRLSDPALYQGSGEEVRSLTLELESAEQTLSEYYQRWEELEVLGDENRADGNEQS